MAFLFVKPHACSPQFVEKLLGFLEDQGVETIREGSIDASTIDSDGIIDSHYSGIARVAMAKDIKSLGLGPEQAKKFQAGYGVELEQAIADGDVCTAVTAIDLLGVDPSELLRRCLAAGYEKLGSGLYAARLDRDGDAGPVYVLNGFYARLREKFVTPGVVLQWFLLRFSKEKLPWETFRKEVIGSTNPSDAVEGSIRGMLRDSWKEWGLKAPPDYQDNGVHASAGPLEALKERAIWLGDKVQEDPFGEAVAAAGLDLEALMENPTMELGGKTAKVFDLLEDTDAEDALAMLVAAGKKAD